MPYILSVGVVSELLIVNWSSFLLAIFTLLLAISLYVWAPKRHINTHAFVVYVFLITLTASLIMSTGETSSPFVAAWIAVTVFAGIFGLKGFLFVAIAIAGYSTYSYLNFATVDSLIITGVAGIVPLIASFIIWHSKSNKEDKHDKAYTELASELSHEANKSEIVLSAINDGVIAVDKQGVIQLINPAAQSIIGWGKSEALGLSYKSVIKLRDKAEKEVTTTNDPVEQVLATAQQVHSEDFSVTTEAGKKVLLSLVVSPLGQPSTGAIMVLRDMTKEKAEEREQAEFISTASHEMRTPVASIEGYLGLVLNPATAQIDDKAREYVEKAQSSAKHLGRLFQDLLDVSKAEDGRISNNPKVVDVVEFVGEVVEGLRPKAAEKQLRFLYKPRPDATSDNRRMNPVFYAEVDNDHLREVVANLTENAIKYTPSGDIVIDVTGTNETITISIQDSGLGIPSEDIPHLFQKFYRVDSTDTREIGGTGLGLYLCRRLAELMNGQIKVKSEYKKGSTFLLEIPRISHEEATQRLESLATEETTETTAPPAYDPQPAQPLPAQPATEAPILPPAPAPTPPPLPQPTPPQPVATPAAPTQPTVVPSADPQNTPLNEIEQNPASYQARRPNMQVPPRSPDNQ